MMHAVMMTSIPSINYWQPTSLAIMNEVRELRKKGIACAYTLDAGPNVHVISESSSLPVVKEIFQEYPGIQKIFISKTGKAARLA